MSIAYLPQSVVSGAQAKHAHAEFGQNGPKRPMPSASRKRKPYRPLAAKMRVRAETAERAAHEAPGHGCVVHVGEPHGTHPETACERMMYRRKDFVRL